MNTYYDPVTGGTYTTGAGGKIASGAPGASGINPATGAINQQTNQTSRQMNVGGSTFNIPSSSVIDTTKMTTFTPATGKTEQSQLSQPAQMPTELARPVEYKPEVSVAEVKGGKEEDFNTWINEDRAKREQITQSVLGSNQKEMADADFINQVAMAKYGRAATKDELSAVGANKFGLIGATKGDVLNRFGLKQTTTGVTGLPTNSVVVDNDGAQITTDEAGIPDVSQSNSWVSQFENLLTQIQSLSKPSAEETGLRTQMADLEGSARLGISNLGQELGAAMPLIQGEQAYLENQANIKLQTLAAKLGVVQEARIGELTSLQNTFQLGTQLQGLINQEKQMIYNEMQKQSANAQSNLALILDSYKSSGGVDTSKMTLDQKLQLSNLAKQAGLDSSLVMSAIDAIYNGSIVDNINNQLKNTPTSYQEWSLAGQPGTYASWLASDGGTKTTPSLPLVKINGVDYVQNEDGSLSIPTVPVDTEATQLQKTALDASTELLRMFNDGYGTGAVGKSRLFSINPFTGEAYSGTKTADFETKFNNLSASLQLDAVKYLKGQGSVTDSERKLLADAVSGLSLKQSEKAFKSTLQDIMVGLGKEGTIQVKDDGTYTYKQLDGNIYRGKVGDNYVDKTTPRNVNFSGVTSVNTQPANKSVAQLQTIPDGLKGGQCGRFVNQITGLGVGDSYESKMSKMDPSIKYPAPGMIFTMPYGDTGHIGFIVGIDGDHAIVKDSNYFINSNPETVATHRLPIAKMTGFRALA